MKEFGTFVVRFGIRVLFVVFICDVPLSQPFGRDRRGGVHEMEKEFRPRPRPRPRHRHRKEIMLLRTTSSLFQTLWLFKNYSWGKHDSRTHTITDISHYGHFPSRTLTITDTYHQGTLTTQDKLSFSGRSKFYFIEGTCPFPPCPRFPRIST